MLAAGEKRDVETRALGPDTQLQIRPPFPEMTPAVIRGDTLSFDPSRYEKQLLGEHDCIPSKAQPIMLPNNSHLTVHKQAAPGMQYQ